MHPTNDVTVIFKGLGRHSHYVILPHEVAKNLYESLETEDERDSIPAHEAFPELADPVLRPAVMLRGGRYRENLTQKQLAEKLGIRQHHLSEMENAKRPIGKEMAKRLAEILRMDYKRFL